MLIDQFSNYSLAVLGRSERTVSEYAKEVRYFCSWLRQDALELADDDLIHLATRNDLQAYIEACSLAGNKNSTRARKISSLRSFYNWAVDHGHVLTNPITSMPRPKYTRPLPVYLSLSDAKALITTSRKRNDLFFRHRNTAILQLFLQCALRLSELANIQLADCYGDAILITGKGAKERYVYLNVGAQKALARWLVRRGREPGPLWISKQYFGIGSYAIYSVIRHLLSDAGLNTAKLSPHKLRHTAATLLYRYGQVDIRLLQQILGHASISTTEIYTHVVDEQIISAMQAHPLADY